MASSRQPSPLKRRVRVERCRCARPNDCIDELLRRRIDGGVILVDLENTAFAYHARPEERIRAVSELMTATSHRCRVLLVSNSRGWAELRRSQVATDSAIVLRAHKPFTRRSKLGLLRHEVPLAVVGDQVTTDGLLAWRLGCTFHQVRLDPSREPIWPRALRLLGLLFLPLFRGCTHSAQSLD